MRNGNEDWNGGSKVLSPREMQALECAAGGRTSAQIGEIMKISRRTAEEHLANARLKLRTHKTMAAVAIWLMRNGDGGDTP